MQVSFVLLLYEIFYKFGPECWCYVAGIHPSEKMDDDCLKHVEERKKVSWYILRKFLTRKIVGWIEEKNNLLALRPFTHLPLAHPSLIYAPPPSTLVTGRKSRKNWTVHQDAYWQDLILWDFKCYTINWVLVLDLHKAETLNMDKLDCFDQQQLKK